MIYLRWPFYLLGWQLYDYLKGGVNRYPLCCIVAYCLTQCLHRRPGDERGRIERSSDDSYVPCKRHMKNDLRWKPMGEM